MPHQQRFSKVIEVVPDLDLVVVVSALDDPASFDGFSLAQMINSQLAPVVGG